MHTLKCLKIRLEMTKIDKLEIVICTNAFFWILCKFSYSFGFILSSINACFTRSSFIYDRRRMWNINRDNFFLWLSGNIHRRDWKQQKLWLTISAKVFLSWFQVVHVHMLGNVWGLDWKWQKLTNMTLW